MNTRENTKPKAKIYFWINVVNVKLLNTQDYAHSM